VAGAASRTHVLASVDGAVPRGHQRSQCFTLAAGPRPGWSLLPKHDTGGTDRVERIALPARAAFSPQPAHLEDVLTRSGQEAGKAGTELAAALHSKRTPPRSRAALRTPASADRHEIPEGPRAS
jgi:hypothetical protein